VWLLWLASVGPFSALAVRRPMSPTVSFKSGCHVRSFTITVLNCHEPGGKGYERAGWISTYDSLMKARVSAGGGSNARRQLHQYPDSGGRWPGACLDQDAINGMTGGLSKANITVLRNGSSGGKKRLIKLKPAPAVSLEFC